MEQSYIADKFYVKSDDTFKNENCKIFRKILHRNLEYFVLVTIISTPF